MMIDFLLFLLLSLYIINLSDSLLIRLSNYKSIVHFKLINNNKHDRVVTILRDGVNADIISPFDTANTNQKIDDDDEFDEDELPLTRDNVEKVLDEMRPYLKSDGGNVKLTEIDGPVVKLELEGACGTCPSSSMTMKMGLERKLKERIPEIAEVIQVLPDAPVLNNEAVETVLDGVRPFLSIAGGKISVASITGIGSLQPVVSLKMEGTAAALQSVKLEIMQRIQRHFMLSLKVEWL
mmetsp:Transcript_15968/g.14444  ORF Transcript_15968/g.14444 Transcript_15968/m.14444 type:complete len:237 (+) Transcript_15968:84-794(+)